MKNFYKKLAKSFVIVYTHLCCDIKSVDVEGCCCPLQVFPQSNVQFKKPGDKVTVLNIGIIKATKWLCVYCSLSDTPG